MAMFNSYVNLCNKLPEESRGYKNKICPLINSVHDQRLTTIGITGPPAELKILLQDLYPPKTSLDGNTSTDSWVNLLDSHEGGVFTQWFFVSSGNLTFLLKIAIEILSFPIENCDFSRAISNYQRVSPIQAQHDSACLKPPVLAAGIVYCILSATVPHLW